MTGRGQNFFSKESTVTAELGSKARQNSRSFGGPDSSNANLRSRLITVSAPVVSQPVSETVPRAHINATSRYNKVGNCATTSPLNNVTANKKKFTTTARKTKSVGVQVSTMEKGVPTINHYDNYFLKYQGDLVAGEFRVNPTIPINMPTSEELKVLLNLSFPSYIRQIDNNRSNKVS